MTKAFSFDADFNKAHEIKDRFDGSFNLWQQVTIFDKVEGFTQYWQVVGVFPSFAEAAIFKDALKKASRGEKQQ
jgi:hypothetical protein